MQVDDVIHYDEQINPMDNNSDCDGNCDAIFISLKFFFSLVNYLQIM
jgi:hypothetical protein